VAQAVEHLNSNPSFTKKKKKKKEKPSTIKLLQDTALRRRKFFRAPLPSLLIYSFPLHSWLAFKNSMMGPTASQHCSHFPFSKGEEQKLC
jgi:hypothetical protein